MSGKDRYDWSIVDPFLEEHYSKMSAVELSKVFPEFKPSQLRDRAKLLGLNKQPKFKWTTETKQYVIDQYPKVGARAIAEHLKISLYSVNKMAQSLGVKYQPKDTYVTLQGYRVNGKSDSRELEHRQVMSKHLGRKLSSSELVHHIDGDKLNNEISNLVITNRSDHINTHRHDLDKGKQTKI